MWDMLLEAIRQVFARMGIDLAKGRTWIVHETDWVNGRRRIVRIGYDAEGREIGRSVTDETDDGAGNKTSTTTFYGPDGHEAGKQTVVTQVDPDGHATTTTTYTDGQGHVTSH
jgi:hypothetical protein